MAHLAAALVLVHALTRAADRCDSPQTQAEMNVCAAAEFRRADAQMNAVYRKLTATLAAGRRGKLQTAQRAWLVFRDAHCAFEASAFEGGTMRPMEYSACATNVTKERIGHLRQALDAPR